jgi:hypothetical protein
MAARVGNLIWLLHRIFLEVITFGYAFSPWVLE